MMARAKTTFSGVLLGLYAILFGVMIGTLL